MEPRLIPRTEAANYCGVSVNTFEEHVKRGLFPKSLRVGKRNLWDRVKLDKCIDQLSGLTPTVNKDEIEQRVLMRASR